VVIVEAQAVHDLGIFNWRPFVLPTLSEGKAARKAARLRVRIGMLLGRSDQDLRGGIDIGCRLPS